MSHLSYKTKNVQVIKLRSLQGDRHFMAKFLTLKIYVFWMIIFQTLDFVANLFGEDAADA